MFAFMSKFPFTLSLPSLNAVVIHFLNIISFQQTPNCDKRAKIETKKKNEKNSIKQGVLCCVRCIF